MAEAANLIGRGVLVPAIRSTHLCNRMSWDLICLARPSRSASVFWMRQEMRFANWIWSARRGVNVLAWDGLTSSGSAAATGKYTFLVDATQGGQKVSNTALFLGS